MSNWWYAASVDVTNGSKQVKVNDGDDIRYLERGSAWLKVVGHEAVETDGAFENDQGEKVIRLVKEWDGQTDTSQRATAFRTVPDFQGVADKLALNIKASQDVVDNIISKIGTLLTSTDESVIIETSEGDVEVVPFARLVQEMEAQFSQFLGSNQSEIDAATMKLNAANIQREFDEQTTFSLDFVNHRYQVYDGGISQGNKRDVSFGEVVSIERATDKIGLDAIGRVRTAGVNEPVFNWVGGKSKGLSIHEQRTNSFPNPQDITQDTWAKSGTTTPEAPYNYKGIAFTPIFENNSESVHTISRSLSVVAGQPYTYSLVVRDPDPERELGIQATSTTGTATFTRFNFQTMQVIGTSGQYQRHVFEKIDVSTFYIELTYLPTVSGTVGTQFVFRTLSGTVYQGDGRKIMDLGRMQVELNRSFAGPFIDGGASAGTRAADDCSIENIDVSGWFNPYEGTLLVEFDAPRNRTWGDLYSPFYILGFDNGTLRAIGITGTTPINMGVVAISNIPGFDIPRTFRAVTSNRGTVIKLALSYNASLGRIDMFTDGESNFIEIQDPAKLHALMMDVTRFSIQSTPLGSAHFYTIKYAPVALPPEKLQALSAGVDHA